MAEALGSSEEFDKLVKGSKMTIGSGITEEPKINRMYYSPERARVAMICTNPKCNYRRFGDINWVCPDHKRSQRQPNNPYFGTPT